MEVYSFNGTLKSEQNNKIVNLTVDLIERGGGNRSKNVACFSSRVLFWLQSIKR